MTDINTELLEETTTSPEAHRGSGRKIVDIDITLLRKHPLNSEIYGQGESVADLMEAMQSSGEIDPLVVHAEEDGFTILRGHRRQEAGIEICLKTLPCIVLEGLDENQQLKILLTGNVQREKTIEQKTREGLIWEQIYREEAKQVSGKKGRGLGAVRDRVARKVGLGSGVNYERAKEIVAASESNHEKAEEIKKIIADPNGKVLTAYNLIKPPAPKVPKVPTSVKEETAQQQSSLGLGTGSQIFPDVPRNEGDPTTLIDYQPPLPQQPKSEPIPFVRKFEVKIEVKISQQKIEEIKNKILAEMNLGKNNRKYVTEALELFVEELVNQELIESNSKADKEEVA